MPKAVPKLSVPPPVEAQSDTPATKASTPTIDDIVHDLAADVKLAKLEAVRERIRKAFENARALGGTVVDEDLIFVEHSSVLQPLAEPVSKPTSKPVKGTGPRPRVNRAAEPQQSLQELCNPIIERLEQDIHNIRYSNAHNRDTHEIHLPQDLQSQATSLDERCQRLYADALKLIGKKS